MNGPGTPHTAEPRGGTVIADRYCVDSLIARGGMAAVYKANHVKLNRPVALKILSPPPDAEDPKSFEERFQLEAETLASLDHPNIVILHDFGETADGRFFLAMEFVEGPRLTDLIKDGPLPVERALQLIVQVAQALRYAHKRGVVHRDLKPSNLLIRKKDSGEEQIKVVDFGLVKLTEADQGITRAGLILGSPHCMSPEQIRGQEIDHRADVYATGVLLFRCLTGQYPFHGPNSAATMIAHLNAPVPTFFSAAPDLVVPPGLEPVVRKCLEKKPDDRYVDMQALIEDLAPCMAVPADQFRSVSQTASTIQRRIAEPKSSPLPWLLGVAAILLVASGMIGALGLGLWLASGDRPVPAAEVASPSPAVPSAAAVPPPAPLEATVTVEPATPPVEAGVEPPTAQKRPQPPPRPVKKPPAQAKAAPTETKAPTPDVPKKPDQPAGYMGLPDDFEK